MVCVGGWIKLNSIVSYSSIPLWKVPLIISGLLLRECGMMAEVKLFYFYLDVGGLPLDVVIICDFFFMVES